MQFVGDWIIPLQDALHRILPVWRDRVVHLRLDAMILQVLA